MRTECDELAHQRRAPKDALRLTCLVLIQHQSSRVLRTFRRGGSPTPSAIDPIIPSRSRSDLPVRKPCNEMQSRLKDFIRTAPSLEFLDTLTPPLDRIDMTVQLAASLFVGGGSIESKINIAVNSGPLQKPEAKSIFISKLTIASLQSRKLMTTDGGNFCHSLQM